MTRPRRLDPEMQSEPLRGQHGQNQSVTVPSDAQLEQLARWPDVEEPELSDAEYKLLERELEHERRRAHKSH